MGLRSDPNFFFSLTLKILLPFATIITAATTTVTTPTTSTTMIMAAAFVAYRILQHAYLWFYSVVVVKLLSYVWLLQPQWIVACQAPLSMEYPRQEYWNGLTFPSMRHLPDPGIEPAAPELQVDSLLLSHQASPWFLTSTSLVVLSESSHLILKTVDL